MVASGASSSSSESSGGGVDAAVGVGVGVGAGAGAGAGVGVEAEAGVAAGAGVEAGVALGAALEVALPASPSVVPPPLVVASGVAVTTPSFAQVVCDPVKAREKITRQNRLLRRKTDNGRASVVTD